MTIWQWKLSETDPARLVPYIRLKPNPDDISMDGKRRMLLRYLATQRLGDVGDLAVAEMMEKEAQLLEKEEGKYEGEAVRVAIERIRLRHQGTAVYINAMKEWGKTPIPKGIISPGYPSALEYVKAVLRIVDGARALGVARQGEGVILDRYLNDPAFDNCYMGFWLARPPARFESPRTLSALEKAVRKFVPYVQPSLQPLEPGEPDVCVTYWNLRMLGSSQEQRIQYLIKAFREGWAVGAMQMIEFEGQAAVPALMEVVSQPPTPTINGQAARGSAALLLGRLKARDAVPLLIERAAECRCKFTELDWR